MPVSYDPAKMPEVNDEFREMANRRGQGVVLVILDRNADDRQSIRRPPDAPAAEYADAVTFWALADFAPRVGELILSEDERVCVVRRVINRVAPVSGSDGRTVGHQIVPTVYAALVDETEVGGCFGDC